MLISPKMCDDVFEWFEFAMQTLGHDFDVEIGFNYRYTRVLGRAVFPLNGKPKIILAAKIWARASQKERRETVIHETCHLIAYHEAKGKRIRPHGDEWKALMWRCGVKPNRTHDVDVTGLSKRKTIQATCDCPAPHYLTKRKANRILEGTLQCRCTRCKTLVEVVES